MSAFAYLNADFPFQPFTKIYSADLNQCFNDVKTYLNGTLAFPIGISSGGTGVTTARAAYVALSVGTNTNDNAPAGNVGERISSVISSPTNFPTSGQYGDLANISLTAGDWDICAQLHYTCTGNTTAITAGVSITAGDSATGLVAGDTSMTYINGTLVSGYQGDLGVFLIRASLTGSTTYYLKYQGNFSAGAPTAVGRISARRVR